MKNTLKLFAAAAAEMVRTRKARVLFPTVAVGMTIPGAYIVQGRVDNIGISIGATLITGIGVAFLETGRIYNRMKREQKSSPLNNG